jgi:hypothetical protein
MYMQTNLHKYCIHVLSSIVANDATAEVMLMIVTVYAHILCTHTEYICKHMLSPYTMCITTEVVVTTSSMCNMHFF